MRAVVQRVKSAAITIGEEKIASIGKGLFILVGVDRNDDDADMDPIIKKVLNAKLFEDDKGGLWKQSVKECNGEILCMSQFTLFARFKGSKPDFHEAINPTRGKEMYHAFVDECKKGLGADRVQSGIFGSTCEIALINDGPTTITFNTREPKEPKSSAGSAAGSGAATPIDNSEQLRKMEEAKAAKAARKAAFEANGAINGAKRDKAKAERQVRAEASETKKQDEVVEGVAELKVE